MERAQLTIEKKPNNPYIVHSESSNQTDTQELVAPYPTRKQHLDS